MSFPHYIQRAVLFPGAVVFLICAGSHAATLPHEQAALPNLDTRAEPVRAAAQPARPERAAAEALLRTRLPRLQIERDDVVGSPKWISGRDGFLTGPDGRGRGAADVAAAGFAANDPHRVVKTFVREHAGIFGHDHTALERATVKRDYVTPHNGLRTIGWEQRLEGIPVFGGRFTAHVTRNGELVSVASGFMPALDNVAAPAQRALAAAGASPPLPARQSLLAAAQNISMQIDETQVRIEAGPTGAEQRQDFRAPGWDTPARLALVWLPMNENAARLCWRVWLTDPRTHCGYELLVDAETGELLKRRCFTVNASPATYRVFTTDSPTPMSPGWSTPLTNQPPVAARSLLTLTSINATASPNGWVDDGLNELRGNNALAYYSRQVSENSWVGETVHGSPARVFDFPLNLNASPTNSAAAATANAFYWVNWMHDKLYELGFTEAAGNAQETNFNRGGLGGDRMSVHVHSPGDEDNAGMTTYPEGASPQMVLGLFTGPDPDRDSALDAEIILHEYTHALSNRLHENDLDEKQCKGMGEGWSDFYALSLLSQSGDNVNGTYAKGAYSSFHLWGSSYEYNYYAGIRRYPYSTDMAKNPLTFRDIDPNQANLHLGVPINPVLIGFPADEVHMQGEVWCSMLWEARANLIGKYGFATGNQTMLQLVTDGMRSSPGNPSFTTARNAILLEDFVNNGGANLKELWAGFAKRGLGVHAVAPASSTTDGVKESFDSLDDLIVAPATLPVVQGPAGGPFTPNSLTLSLTNDGSSSLTWRARVELPFELSPSSGTLAGGARQTVAIQLNNAAAASLGAGAHQIPLRVTNQTSGVVVQRTLSLVLGVSIPPAEWFLGYGDDLNDLAYSTLVFTPDDSGTRYDVCKNAQAPVVFPTSTSLAQTLDFGDDQFVEVTLTGGAQFPFYGQSYSTLAICEDGNIVLGPAPTDDIAVSPSLAGHFSVPRIAGLTITLGFHYNYTNGIISWKQLADRVVVTWNNMKVGAGLTNNFQVALYFDGRIQMTFLRLDSSSGICGLSPGGGAPPVFVEADLSVSGFCNLAQLYVSVPPFVTEGDGILAGAGQVWRRTPVAFNTTVGLTSSDMGEVTVPASVVIPAGATSAVFNVTVQNDSLRDGTQLAYISAFALNHESGSAPIRIDDNETATLGVQLPSTVTEGGFFGIGTVTVSAPVGGLVTVNLSNSRSEEITVPATVFIPAGQTSAFFLVMAVNDNRIDGPQNATVTASVKHWTSGADTIIALDNESTNLVLKTTFFVNESMGTITNGGSVEIGGTLTNDLLVFIFSDDESEVRTPLFGPFIPAGQTNAFFPLFIQDDAIIDGPILTRLRAVASGFGPATNYVWVGDNDGPPDPYNPYPPHLSENIPLNADLSWGPIEGELLINGTFSSGTLAGWQTEDHGAGGWIINDGTFDPESPDGPLPPLAGSYSALVQQLGNGDHTLWQDVYIPDGSLTALLAWSDRIRNHGGAFSATQQYRVELRNPADNSVLATLFSTGTNHPAFTDWTSRTSNLAPYRGQTVRLAFVEKDSAGHLNVHLDNVSLLADSTATTFFDVYFGTNATPTAADYRGTTTAAKWTLPPLAGGVDYYWQLKVRRSTSTNAGPVWQFTTLGNSTQVTALTFNSVWKYVATGVDLGTGWRSRTYNDNIWPSGTAPLGFGGGQTTTIGNATNEYVTFYFRRRLTLFDTNRLAEVTVRLRRDDGAILYVNGVEAFRNNLPERVVVDYLDSAISNIEGLSEGILVTESIPASMFIEGTNVIAVEIHQYYQRGTFSGDLLFDLEINTRTNTGNLPPAVALTQPLNNTVVQLPASLLLLASLTDDGPSSAYTVEFYADGAKIGQDTLAPYGFTWVNPPPGQYVLTAVATDGGGLSSTSAPVTVIVAPASGAVFTMIPAGAEWHYNDSGLDLGTAWTSRSYRESRWRRGPAQLGYGDGDEATVVSYGGNPLNRHITTYFRHPFDLAASLSSLTLRVLRDDGVAVYLNGTEIFRNNLPAGSPDYQTLASVALNPRAESAWLTSNLNAPIVIPLLETGNNVIAAEVHQASTSSADLSFDLELVGVGNLLPNVALTSPANNTVAVTPANVLLTASASDPYGSVTNVQFRRDGVLLGNVTTPPYQFPWNNPPAGWHSLTAVATDDSGDSRISSAVNLFVAATVPLAVARSGAFVQLSWPDNAPGYTLETATNLASPISWTATTNAVTQSGGQFRVTISADEAERYFRLRAP